MFLAWGDLTHRLKSQIFGAQETSLDIISKSAQSKTPEQSPFSLSPIGQRTSLQSSSEDLLQIIHDLKAPIAALEFCLKELSQHHPSMGNLANQSVFRLKQITRRVLEKAQREEGISEIAPLVPSYPQIRPNSRNGVLISTHLLSVVQSIVHEQKTLLKSNSSLYIHVKSQGMESVFVEADATELGRCFSNLIQNAIEATVARAGEINIQVSTQGTWARIDICDNGVGIPREVLKRVGEQGFSYGKAQLSQSGLGLGVSHAKRFVAECGGLFQIHSEPNQGTTISMSFPIVSAPKWFSSKLVLEPWDQVAILDSSGLFKYRLEKKLLAQGVSKDRIYAISSLEDWHKFKSQMVVENQNTIHFFCSDQMHGLEWILQDISKKFHGALINIFSQDPWDILPQKLHCEFDSSLNYLANTDNLCVEVIGREWSASQLLMRL